MVCFNIDGTMREESGGEVKCTWRWGIMWKMGFWSARSGHSVLGSLFSKEIKENNENYADEESERDKTTVASTIKLELIHWSKLANSYKTRTIRFFVPN